MRIVSLTALHARIPLKRPIKHASHIRRENDTLLVRAELDDGAIGWGEGLPRTYVTGETIDTCYDSLAALDAAQLAESFGSLSDAVTLLQQLRLPAPPVGHRDCIGNTVRCALELAVLDAVTRAVRVPLSDVARHLPEASAIIRPSSAVRYSTVITSVKPWKEAASAFAFRLYGFEQCKVKVGIAGQDEVASLRRIRRWAGPMDLRVDTNEGWSHDDVERRADSLRRFGITAIEQPLPHADVRRLRSIRPTIGIPIMLDESLCSLGDADLAISEGLCDLFNIRLSKCGGFLNSLLLAAKARSAGLGYQLGCMVGETGILSAAGRHFACAVGGIRYLEGSFDRHLVAEPLTKEDLTFGRGGFAPALTRPGLGMTIDDAAVKRVTVRQKRISLA